MIIDEVDVISEEDKEAGNPPVLLGEAYMMSNFGELVLSSC